MPKVEDLGTASDDQVILAWLQAEVESPPFQSYLIGDPPKPSHLARGLALARNPDLDNAQHNVERRRIIASAHGFGRGPLIFAGLEDDIRWRRVRASIADVAAMLYSNRNEGDRNVLEGHRLPDGADAFIGDSPSINKWAYA